MTGSSNRATPWLTAGVLVFLLIEFLVGFVQMKGHINDEAIEILQARDLPLDRYYLFAPPYHDGVVDVIESTGPYIVKLSESVFGRGPVAIRLPCFVSLCIGILLFSRLAGRFGGANVALVLSAASSYLLFYNRIATRNGFSFFWSVLLLTVFVRIAESRQDRPFNAWTLAALPLIGTLSITTYSSFKLIVPALYLVLGIDALVRPHRARRLLAVLTGVALQSAILLILVWLSRTPLKLLFGRGAYAMRFGDNIPHSILRNLMDSLLLPFVQPAGRDFVIDITHAVFDRRSLSLVLVPFAVYWMILLFFRSGRLERMIAGAWFASTAMLSIGGPSLKHLHATFPFVLLMAVLGVTRLGDRVAERSKPLATVLTVSVCMLAGIFEMWHLLWVIPTSPVMELEVRLPRRRAEIVRALAAEGPLIYAEDFAKDTMRLLTRDLDGVSYLPYQGGLTGDLLFRLLNRQPVRMIRFDRSPLQVFVDHPEIAGCFDSTIRTRDEMEYTEYLRRTDCAIGWGWVLL